MKSSTKISVLLVTFLILLTPKTANAKILSGNGTNAGGTGNSCSTYGDNSYAWDSDHLAWYKFTFLEGVSGDTIATVNSSTTLGPGGSISIVKDGESCAKYSDTFYLAAYVPYKCGTGLMLGDSDWKNVSKGTTSHYTAGYPIGFPAGGGKFIITNNDKGLPSGGYPAYSGENIVARGYTVTNSEVLQAWRGLDSSNSGATYVPDSWFCGGEKTDSKKEGYFYGNSKIEIKENGKTVKENTSITTTPIYTIHGTGPKTINFTASGSVSVDASQNNTLASNIERYTTPPNWKLATKGYSESKTTATASKDGTLTMNPGDNEKLCSNNTFHTHYKSDSGGWTNETSSKETCITINYISTTYNMGSVSQVVVRQNKDLKANAFDIDQNSKNATIDFGNATGDTGSVTQQFDKLSSVTVTSGIKPGNIGVFALNKVTKLSKTDNNAADAAIKLTGLTIQNPSNNTNYCQSATMTAEIRYIDCYNSGDANEIIYPEQTQTYTASTAVPSTISASGAISDSKVTTTASVTVTADPLYCSDFNNAQIGVNNAINYGRITIAGDGVENESNSAGNLPDGNWNDTVSKYYAPYGTKGNSVNSLRLSYYACMGYQSLIDSQGGADNVEYVVSTNGRDSAYPSAYRTSNMINERNYNGGAAGKNITAWEIGGDGLTRIEKSYSTGEQSTKLFNLDNNFIGYTTSNNFTWNNSSFGDRRTATVDINVPYNYYLDDDSEPKTDESSDKVIYAGEKPRFSVNTEIKPRVNDAVNQSSNLSSDYKYNTKIIRQTTRTITPIYLDSGVSVSDIKAVSKIVVPGNVVNNAYGVLRAHGIMAQQGALSDGRTQDTDTFGSEDDIANANYNCTEAGGSDCIEFESVEEGHLGDKLCIAVAFYPADSHNSIVASNGTISTPVNNDQSSALNGPDYKNGEEKTLISLSCATVGKKPSMSVEGGSLIVNGAVEAKTTTYGGRTFGSWAEYDIVSGNSTRGIIGSGASFAYANAQTDLNASRTDGDGLESGKLAKPQSIGNTASGDKYGSDEESSTLAARYEGGTSPAWQFANNIYQKFIADGVSHPDLVKTTLRGGESVGELLKDGVMQEGKIYLVYSTGKLRIDKDIINQLKETIYVIYSEEGIDIEPEVTRIDAFLIANKNNTSTSSSSVTPTIDTCNDDTDATERNDGEGNQNLLEKCNSTLIINGAVAAQRIKLDRVAGGGSYENSEELKPESLTQRAEIFNYDMRVVFWATKMLDNEDVTNSTYVKELSPRL